MIDVMATIALTGETGPAGGPVRLAATVAAAEAGRGGSGMTKNAVNQAKDAAGRGAYGQ